MMQNNQQPSKTYPDTLKDAIDGLFEQIPLHTSITTEGLASIKQSFHDKALQIQIEALPPDTQAAIWHIVAILKHKQFTATYQMIRDALIYILLRVPNEPALVILAKVDGDVTTITREHIQNASASLEEVQKNYKNLQKTLDAPARRRESSSHPIDAETAMLTPEQQEQRQRRAYKQRLQEEQDAANRTNTPLTAPAEQPTSIVREYAYEPRLLFTGDYAPIRNGKLPERENLTAMPPLRPEQARAWLNIIDKAVILNARIEFLGGGTLAPGSKAPCTMPTFEIRGVLPNVTPEQWDAVSYNLREHNPHIGVDRIDSIAHRLAKSCDTRPMIDQEPPDKPYSRTAWWRRWWAFVVSFVARFFSKSRKLDRIEQLEPLQKKYILLQKAIRQKSSLHLHQRQDLFNAIEIGILSKAIGDRVRWTNEDACLWRPDGNLLTVQDLIYKNQKLFEILENKYLFVPLTIEIDQSRKVFSDDELLDIYHFTGPTRGQQVLLKNGHSTQTLEHYCRRIDKRPQTEREHTKQPAPPTPESTEPTKVEVPSKSVKPLDITAVATEQPLIKAFTFYGILSHSGTYKVLFPDFPELIVNAISKNYVQEKAATALKNHLNRLNEEETEIPTPTPLAEIGRAYGKVTCLSFDMYMDQDEAEDSE